MEKPDHVDLADLMTKEKYRVIAVDMWIKDAKIYTLYEIQGGPFNKRTIIEQRPFQMPWRMEKEVIE